MFFSFMDNTQTPIRVLIDLSPSQVATEIAALTGDSNCIERIRLICEHMAVGECLHGMPEYQSINGNYGYIFGRQEENLKSLFNSFATK